MKQKILKGKITGAPKGSWYEKNIGKKAKVIAFTHNYYLAAGSLLMYRLKDIKLTK